MKSHSGPSNIFLDNGTSLPRIRYLYGNYKFSDFKYEAKAVALARSDIRFFSAQLITNNLATLGAWTFLALIGNGIAALQIYRNSIAGKQAMKDTYSILGI
ncbi:MAG: hypothetical protein ACQEWV_32845, partial [Bacillota bacterium]